MKVMFIDNTPTVITSKNAAVQKALEMIGLQAEAYAKIQAPVDTGRLRNSIMHMQQGSDTEIIATNVEYAPYQEFGTSRIPPHPFIRPAAQNHSAEYKAIAEACLRGA